MTKLITILFFSFLAVSGQGQFVDKVNDAYKTIKKVKKLEKKIQTELSEIDWSARFSEPYIFMSVLEIPTLELQLYKTDNVKNEIIVYLFNKIHSDKVKSYFKKHMEKDEKLDSFEFKGSIGFVRFPKDKSQKEEIDLLKQHLKLVVKNHYNEI